MSVKQQELCYLTIRDAGRLIRDRKLSPVELTQACLDRIEAVDGDLKSFLVVLDDSALAEARAAEAEILKGEYRGPLHGIPVAHKDQYAVKGVLGAGMPREGEAGPPAEDAAAVRKLREAGTVLLGKVVMYGTCMGGPGSSIPPLAHNPWDLDHMPGGSSSGSGATVAAGLCMGSMGEDTAGSIRGPAMLCGIVGLKPTYGRVSRRGLSPLSWSLDHCGPMARTVEDTALMLQAVAGFDDADPTTYQEVVPDYAAALREDINGVIIGVPREYYADPDTPVEPETAAAIEKALADLEGLGARIEEVKLPSLEYVTMTTLVIWFSETFTYYRERLTSHPEMFADPPRSYLELASLLSSSDYVQAQRARNRIKEQFAEVLRKVDVIAMPCLPGPAPTFDEYDPTEIMTKPSLRAPFALVGIPGLAIPCGFSETGLPLGFQLGGRPFDESMVFRVAYTYQQHTGWFRHRPGI